MAHAWLLHYLTVLRCEAWLQSASSFATPLTLHSGCVQASRLFRLGDSQSCSYSCSFVENEALWAARQIASPWIGSHRVGGVATGGWPRRCDCYMLLIILEWAISKRRFVELSAENLVEDQPEATNYSLLYVSTD